MSSCGKRQRRHSFTTVEDVSKQLEISTQPDSSPSTTCTTVKEDSSSRKRPISPSCVSEGSSPKERPAANVVTASTDQQQTNKVEYATVGPATEDIAICLPQGNRTIIASAGSYCTIVV